MKKKKIKITFSIQILVSFILAIIVGSFLRKSPDIAIEYIKPYGTIFLNLLKCFVCLGIFFAIIYGIANLRDPKKIGKVGMITVIYYLCTTIIAILGALIIANLMKDFFPIFPTDNLSYGPVDTDIDFLDTLSSMFPSNIVSPFYDANMLQIMVTASIIGVSLILLSELDEIDMSVINKANGICTKVLQLIIKLSPVGLFCMVCPDVAVHGFELVKSLAMVLLSVYLAYAIQVLGVYSLTVKSLGHISPKKFFKGMMPAIMFAFSSTSSMGTLPLNIDCAQKLGADLEVASVIMPLGAVFNMDGTAIYQGVCAVFIASCYGVDFSFSQMVMIVITTVLSSIGTAGIPSASMVMLAMVLESAGLPIAGIALVTSVDTIFGMGRTVVNVTGDASCAIIVSEIMRRHKERKEKRAAKT